MNLEVLIKSFAGSDPGQTWTFNASGAGFKQGVARLNAEERLLKQISTDTKMSFVEIFPTNQNQ